MPDWSSFNDNPLRTVTALCLASLVALAAWRLRALTADGGLATAAVGTAIVGGAGWWVGCLLIVFFVTASALSKAGAGHSTAIRQQRGSRRDAVQVLANGAGPVLFALLAGISGNHLLVAASIGAIATATADTWATEIGRLTRATPIAITTGRRVPPGTSGAVSVPGTLASVAGAALIGAGAWWGAANGWIDAGMGSGTLALVVTIAGVTGSLLDSLFGATVQEMFACAVCGTVTETREHLPGHHGRRVRGLPGASNDVVNLASVILAGLLPILLGAGAA